MYFAKIIIRFLKLKTRNRQKGHGEPRSMHGWFIRCLMLFLTVCVTVSASERCLRSMKLNVCRRQFVNKK